MLWNYSTNIPILCQVFSASACFIRLFSKSRYFTDSLCNVMSNKYPDGHHCQVLEKDQKSWRFIIQHRKFIQQKHISEYLRFCEEICSCNGRYSRKSSCSPQDYRLIPFPLAAFSDKHTPVHSQMDAHKHKCPIGSGRKLHTPIAFIFPPRQSSSIALQLPW